MTKLGLLGKSLKHTFSKNFFEEKFQREKLVNFSYDLFELESELEIPALLNTGGLVGLNVTFPYKQSVIPYLDDLDETAQKIGAVNTILIKDGKKIGFNTDAWGFAKTLFPEIVEHSNSSLLIGNGGASKAVQFVLTKLNIPFVVYSRTASIGVERIESLTKEIISKHHLIVQCSPVGTYPDVDAQLQLPYEGISAEHFCIDLIYNPKETHFIRACAARGATTKNGLQMLHAQAEESWRIWTS